MGCGRSRQKDMGAPSPTIADGQDDQGGEAERKENRERREDQRQKAETNLQAISHQSSISVEKNWESAVTGTSRGSGVSTPQRILSYNSQLDFASPQQTIIIFDWDDTLCPSSSLRKNAMDSSGRMKTTLNSGTWKDLQQLSDQVIPLIELAQVLGKVVMVTNAKKPWVDTSCDNFLPKCKTLIEPIPVMYALEIMEDVDPEKSLAKGHYLTETKARAMKAAVTNFYSRYPNQSWKNVISIGDAFFEHDAIRQVTRDRPYRENEAKKCFTKTVKLLEGPSTSGLITQLSIILSWLTKIVQLDADVDIDLAADEKTIQSWAAQFGQEASETV